MLSVAFSQIVNSRAPLTHVEGPVKMRPEFLTRSQKLLYQAQNVCISGDLFYNEPYVTGNFRVQADLVVPSSRSLAPVAYQQDFHFSENYTDAEVTKDELDDSGIPLVQVVDDQIDLQTAIEDNILLHIPTTILTKEEEENNLYPHGQGWSVMSETEFNAGKANQINPAFAKLKNFFNEDDDNQTQQ